MKVLEINEVEEVSGGIVGVIIAVGVIALAGLAVGIYNGYQDAKHAQASYPQCKA